MNYYISDTHLGAEYIISSDNRPFETVEEMDKTIMDNWNSVVSRTDTVFIIGDFCVDGLDSRRIAYYLKRLNGRKHLILGNHDKSIMRDTKITCYFESISKMKTISDEDKKIILCHFPIIDWEGYNKGTYHIYGHLHKNITKSSKIMLEEERALNAGCMLNNFTPMTFEQLVERNIDFRKEIFSN